MLFTVTQYLESVLNSRGLTRTLGEIDVCRTADGRPVFHTGNSAVIFRIRLDAFARRGDAVGYRTAQLLRSPVAKLPQAASLFAWRLRPPRPADDPPELAVDAGRWGFRSGGRFVIPPVWDNGFDFSEGLAAVEIAGRWHFIDTAGRVVLNCPPCDAVKPFRNGTAELRSGLRREKISVEKLTLKRYICRLEI